MQHCVNIIVTAGLSDKKLRSKLLGLTHCKQIKKIYLIRRTPLTNSDNKNIVNLNPPNSIVNSFLLYEIWRLYKMSTTLFAHSIHMLYAIQLIPHSFHTYICSIVFNKPIVLSVIGDDVHIHLKNSFIRPVLKKVIRKASFITALGPRSTKQITSTGFAKNRIIKILNYIDEKSYQPDNSINKKWDLIFTGDLVAVKALDVLIKAFSSATINQPDIRLCIVGNGPEKKFLKTLARRLNCEKKIDFINKTDNICKYINKSKVLIMTSKSEALPASAIEAAFCGLPTILPDVGDITGLFKHNISSLIFTSGNMNELVAAIENLLGNKACYTKLSSGAMQVRSDYIARYNIEQQASYWEDIINQINKAA